MHVLTAPGARLVGLQATEVSAPEAARLRVAVLVTPLRVPVMTTVWFLLNRPATAVKLTAVAPAATVV